MSKHLSGHARAGRFALQVALWFLVASVVSSCVRLAGYDPGGATGCDNDFDCTGDDVCLGGSCAKACLETSECNDGERCYAHDEWTGLCRAPTTACTQRSDCGDKEICDDAYCVPAECVHTSSCDYDVGEECIEGRCALRSCSDADDCASGEKCQDGQCRPASYCEGDGDCAPAEACEDSSCVAAPCSSDADCSPYRCEGTRCATSCSQYNASCHPDANCRDGECRLELCDADSAASVCKGYLCDLDAGKCEPDCYRIGCTPDYLCDDDDRCIRRCDQMDDAACEGFACNGSLCKTTCSNDGDCATGYVCESSGCVR